MLGDVSTVFTDFMLNHTYIMHEENDYMLTICNLNNLCAIYSKVQIIFYSQTMT